MLQRHKLIKQYLDLVSIEPTLSDTFCFNLLIVLIALII